MIVLPPAYAAERRTIVTDRTDPRMPIHQLRLYLPATVAPALEGATRAAVVQLVREGFRFPRPAAGHRHGPPWQWLAPVYRNIIAVLRNPFYAGAYAYGKSTHRTIVLDGRLAKTHGHDQPMAAWRVLLRDQP
jgi:hypothetical protein